MSYQSLVSRIDLYIVIITTDKTSYDSQIINSSEKIQRGSVKNCSSTYLYLCGVDSTAKITFMLILGRLSQTGYPS